MRFDIKLLGPVVGLVFAPLLLGIIQSVSCWVEGRRGAPLLQAYFDLGKLLRKSVVVSPRTSWLFSAGPIVSLASLITALFVVPFGNLRAPVWFPGDAILFVLMLAVARLSMLLATIDAGVDPRDPRLNRKVWSFVLIEPTVMLVLIAVSRIVNGHLSLSTIHGALTFSLWNQQGLILILAAISTVVVVVQETSEIRIGASIGSSEFNLSGAIQAADHSGPDLAFLKYSLMLKQWLLGVLVLNIMLPSQTHSIIPVDFISIVVDTSATVCGMILLTLLLGLIEATTARVRSPRISQLLLGASAVAALALALTIQPERPEMIGSKPVQTPLDPPGLSR